jgi:hypothetical protein
MYIPDLKALYRSMRNERVTRQRFDYVVRKRNSITLSVAFLIDRTPFKLMLGCKDHNIFFILDVLPGFEVDPFQIDKDVFARLCKALGLQYDPANPYTRKAFLEEFRDSGQIRTMATRIEPKPHELPVNTSTIEEGDKLYFKGWRVNPPGKNVTPENLAKTREFCGDEFAAICEEENISSCWSADPADEKPMTRPGSRRPKAARSIGP